jgi:hypothetical protein
MYDNKWSIESKLGNMLHAGKGVKVLIDWMNAHRASGKNVLSKHWLCNWWTRPCAWIDDDDDDDDDNDDDDDDEIHCNVYCGMDLWIVQFVRYKTVIK